MQPILNQENKKNKIDRIINMNTRKFTHLMIIILMKTYTYNMPDAVATQG